MPEPTTIDLPSVVQRFRDSAEALDKLREQLRHLELAQDIQEDASASIASAAEALTDTAVKTASVVDELRSASSLTTSSLELAREFLERSDLSALNAVVQEVASAIAGIETQLATELTSLSAAVASHHAMVDGRIQSLEATLSQQLVAAQSELAHAHYARLAAEARIAAIPEKYRRKLGL